MRARIAVVLAVALALVGGAVAFVTYSRAQAARPVAHARLPVRPDSYLGVYEHGSPPPFTAVQGFSQAAGRSPNLAGYFSGWGQPFESGFARTARAHHMTVLVQIDPTGASVAGIVSGKYDGWLRSYADSVRDFGSAVVLGFGHEMNATWYSWGYHHVSPATFIAAWRHVVTLFRGQGADNVTWLWTVQGDVPGTGPVRDWWPGRQYVTWVGVDAYYYRRSDAFSAVFGQTITQIRDFTRRPVLLSETSVGPAAGQPAKIADLFRGMAAAKALGLVWFDISQHDGIYHQDWRLEDNPAAAAAFRRNAAAYLTGESG